VFGKGDENRRKERREAALRVVAELASEETAGPRRLEAALAVAGDRVPRPPAPPAGKAAPETRTRRPTPPPPIPPGAARPSGAAPAVATGPVPPSPPQPPQAAAGPPTMAPPAPGAPIPGRPLLGQGMLARYGQQEPAGGPGEAVAEARRGLRWALLTVLALAAIAALVKLL